VSDDFEFCTFEHIIHFLNDAFSPVGSSLHSHYYVLVHCCNTEKRKSEEGKRQRKILKFLVFCMLKVGRLVQEKYCNVLQCKDIGMLDMICKCCSLMKFADNKTRSHLFL
jgi:hypothetical protein